MVTIIRRILFAAGVRVRSLQIFHGCIIFQEPEIKIQVLQLQMHRSLTPECLYQALLFYSNRNLQSQEYMTVFEQMWQGVNQSTEEIQLQSGKETNSQAGCFVMKKSQNCVLSSNWPLYLPFILFRPTWYYDTKIHLHGYVSVSTVSLCYRTCRLVSVSTVKRHQTTFRCNGTAGKLEHTSPRQNRNRSLQAIRGTVKVTVPDRSFFHPQTSNQICFPEKSVQNYFPMFWKLLDRWKTDNLLSSSYVKSLLWDTQDVPVMSLKMSTHLWVRWTQNLNMQDKEVSKPATRCSQEWVTKAKDIEVKTRVMFKFTGSGKKYKWRPISLATLSVR